MTSFVVTTLAVNEEDGKVADVEVSDGSIKPGGEGPCESHNEVATIRGRDLCVSTTKNKYIKLEKRN